jgi:hypothetical protein
MVVSFDFVKSSTRDTTFGDVMRIFRGTRESEPGPAVDVEERLSSLEIFSPPAPALAA